MSQDTIVEAALEGAVEGVLGHFGLTPLTLAFRVAKFVLNDTHGDVTVTSRERFESDPSSCFQPLATFANQQDRWLSSDVDDRWVGDGVDDRWV